MLSPIKKENNMKIIETDRISCDTIHEIKLYLGSDFDTYLENYISDQDIWDEEIISHPNGKDEEISTYKKLWKRNKDKDRGTIEQRIDDNELYEFVEYIANQNGMEYGVRDDGQMYMVKYDVELETQSEAVQLLAKLVKSGVKVDFQKLHAQVLKEVIK
jgi:hypothetical protein